MNQRGCLSKFSKNVAHSLSLLYNGRRRKLWSFEKQKRFRHIDFLRQHYLVQVIRDCLSLVFVRHPRHAYNVKQQAE